MISSNNHRFLAILCIYFISSVSIFSLGSNNCRNAIKPIKPASVSLFTCQTPSITDFTENRPYELGMKFKSSQNGVITGIRYWKAPSESGQHIGRIWDANGNQLAVVEFKNETASEWQTQILDQALTIQKNTVYIISVNANAYYVSSYQGLLNEVKNCPLSNITDGKNGVYGDPAKFPTLSYSSSNYFRDIIFSTTETGNCPPSFALPDTFIHRGYLGWINDLATSPRPNDNWPSIQIDDELIQDYGNTFVLMQHIGLNEISIWGLFAARAWPLDIEHTVDSLRRYQILKIIETAHQHGIKVLSGLGVYCWGFDDIIRANPMLGCSSNSSIMCPNNPDAWNWQKRIIDYIFRFPIDGVSMQSADQGRCTDCKELDTLSDVAYHAIINDKVAEYIKQNYPGKLVGVNTFGMNLGNPADLSAIQKMTAHADYLIDVNKSVLNGGNAHLCNVVHAMAPCSYGTLGTPGIEPPMHWERDRWFLPMIKRRSQSIKQFYDGGARAVENYMHLIKNPGEEVSLLLVAALEKDPSLNWETALKNVLTEIYQPNDNFTLQFLFDLFVKAEDVYYENAQGVPDIISLEPLVSGSVGPAIYLRDRMNPSGMLEYKKNLCVMRTIFASCVSKVNNPTRLEYLLRCIDGVINDINVLTNNTTGCSVVKTKETTKYEEKTLRIAVSYMHKKGEIRILIWNPQSWHLADMKLWSYDGKLLKSSKITLVLGNNEINVSDTGLVPGFYFVEISDSIFKKVEHLKLFVE